MAQMKGSMDRQTFSTLLGNAELLACEDGVYTVGLSVGAKHKYYCLHRLVADTFIPNPYGAHIVKHKDGNHSNCDVRNLAWYNKGNHTKVAHAA